MLRLFKSIFGGEEPGRYPDSLVDAAVERAVDGTDSRLRTLPGYRKTLRAPVIHAIDHVVTIIDSLPTPLPIDRSAYASDPRLTTLFASFDRVLDVLVHAEALGEFLALPGNRQGQVTALLLAEPVEKQVLGIERDGEMLRRDVAQTSVSFSGHRVVDFALSEEETRRQLKRRAFDHLLSLALMRIAETESERASLGSQRALLLRKLKALQGGGWSFGEGQEPPPDAAALQAELDAAEQQLAALGTDDRTLHAHLEITATLLAEAEQHFWATPLELRLDRMNIQRDVQDASARQIEFQALHNARGQQAVMLLVSIAPGDVPQREDFFTAATRYLG